MSSPITWHTRLLLLTFIVLVAIPGARAFGAGDIPDFAFLEGKAFRHGDIESVLEELYKNVGSGFPHFEKNAGKFLLGLAAAAVTGGKGQKFSGRDVRRVYFGNWLRDYSQAADIAGLSKLTMQSIVTVISVLGFLVSLALTSNIPGDSDLECSYSPLDMQRRNSK
ncbi:hypothetical protein FRC03_006058 [Tulasnella sp. 419]|nr:hypothetical protein FRC03_006058 [Tulasnella sp. 419]